jgi:voltage-gated sodium channel
MALYGNSKFEVLRARTRIMHESDAFQMVLAVFIVSGFLIDVVEAQLMPDEASVEQRVFFELDLVVTGAFLIELLVNLFANSNDGFRPFYSRASNWFDTVITVVSILTVVFTLMGTKIPNAKLFRLLRIGRVIRLFKAFKSLQQLIDACTSAIVPVCNAFFILLIISAVYAILGTNVFSGTSPEYFANFHTSLYTM